MTSGNGKMLPPLIFVVVSGKEYIIHTSNRTATIVVKKLSGLSRECHLFSSLEVSYLGLVTVLSHNLSILSRLITFAYGIYQL
jgi:hypothetical protein